MKQNLSRYIRAGLTGAPYEECADAVTRALDVGAGSTVFFYLDPYGIKDLEFEMLRSIYERERRRSTEVFDQLQLSDFYAHERQLEVRRSGERSCAQS